MPAFTGTNLIDRASAIADMHDDFVTPAQWLTWGTVGVARLDAIIDRSGLVYRETEQVLTVPMTNGQQALGDYRAIIAVYEEMTDGRLRRLRMSDPWKRGRQRGNAGETGPAVECYVTEDPATNNLVLRLWPRPLSGTYVMYYLAASTVLATVGTTVRYPAGWEEYIVLHMAEQALIKEESDPRSIQAAKAQAEAKVQEDCWARLMGQSPTIRNVDATERGGRGIYREGDYPSWNDWWFA